MHNTQRLGTLDLLRAVAAIGVCISHVLGALRTTDHPLAKLLPVWEATLFLRVPILFWISGFVIATTLRNQNFSLQSSIGFLKRRLVGVMIPLWLALIFTYGYEKVLWLTGYTHIPSRSVIDIILNALCMQDYFGIRRWIDPTWSLSYEIQFYVLTAIAWLFSHLSRPSIQKLLIFAKLITILVITSNLTSLVELPRAYGFWHLRWFGLGIICAFTYWRRVPLMFTWICVLAQYVGLLLEYKQHNPVVPAIAVLLLALYTSIHGLQKYMIGPKTSPEMSTFSYCLYLVHWPLASHSFVWSAVCVRLGIPASNWPYFAIIVPILASVMLAKPILKLTQIVLMQFPTLQLTRVSKPPASGG
jgi:peptidoglycan/LPS O-acetylase OafA/YrhL